MRIFLTIALVTGLFVVAGCGDPVCVERSITTTAYYRPPTYYQPTSYYQPPAYVNYQPATTVPITPAEVIVPTASAPTTTVTATVAAQTDTYVDPFPSVDRVPEPVRTNVLSCDPCAGAFPVRN